MKKEERRLLERIKEVKDKIAYHKFAIVCLEADRKVLEHQYKERYK